MTDVLVAPTRHHSFIRVDVDESRPVVESVLATAESVPLHGVLALCCRYG